MRASSEFKLAVVIVASGSPIMCSCTKIDYCLSSAPRQSVCGTGYPRPERIVRAASVQVSRLSRKGFETALTTTVPGSPSANHVRRFGRGRPRLRGECSDHLQASRIRVRTTVQSSSVSTKAIHRVPAHESSLPSASWRNIPIAY
jgi:hypothetical protein